MEARITLTGTKDGEFFTEHATRTSNQLSDRQFHSLETYMSLCMCLYGYGPTAAFNLVLNAIGDAESKSGVASK